jgi:hypothetical protein
MDCGAGGDYEMEGTGYHIDAVHGAADFDRPGGAAAAAAKLICRLGLEKIFPPREAGQAGADCPNAILIHEPGQGHFPAWLMRRGAAANHIVLSGRNILALEAARHNTAAAVAAADMPGSAELKVQIVPTVELPGGCPAFPEQGAYRFIAAFPETVPLTDRSGALWEALARLLAPGGTALVALPSSEAEKFDRQKPAGGSSARGIGGGAGSIDGGAGGINDGGKGPSFTRLGDIKRQGFRAMAYRRG